MPVIRIENSKDMSSAEFQQMLQEAWENGSPLDDLLKIVWQLVELEQKYSKPSLPTFPHHKHVSNRVEPCQEPDLQDVLREIDTRLYPQPTQS